MRRVTAEYRAIITNGNKVDEGIHVIAQEMHGVPVWKVEMRCIDPDKEMYNKIFSLEVQFFPSYPMKPPLIRFTCPITHDTPLMKEEYMIDMLNPCCWNPSVSADRLLIEIQSLL